MPYTLGLLGSLPRIDAGGSSRLTPIKGTPPSLLNLPPGCPFEPRCPMSRDECRQSEPALEPVSGGMGHRAACHFSHELTGDLRAGDLAPDQVFEATAADEELVAEAEEKH
jgi:oligopeptide/dipeptide ABC transporter ATP-binding protein